MPETNPPTPSVDYRLQWEAHWHGPNGERLTLQTAPSAAAEDSLRRDIAGLLSDAWKGGSHFSQEPATRLPPGAPATAEEYHQILEDCERRLEEAGIVGSEQVIGLPNGWVPIVEAFTDEIIRIWDKVPRTEDAEIHISQMKEKFGELRCYLGSTDLPEDLGDRVSDLSTWTEAQSSGRCMATGQPGRATSDGWIVTLSPEMEALNATDPREVGRRIYPQQTP